MNGALDQSSRPLSRRAFTLIELLVVVGVIAILASLLSPSLARAKSAARNVQCQSTLQQWGLALLLYVDDFQVYPPAFSPGTKGTTKGPEELVALYFGSENVNGRMEVRCRQRWVGEGILFAYNEFARTVDTHSPYLGLGGDFVRQDDYFDFIPIPESRVKVPSDMIGFSEYVFSRDPAKPESTSKKLSDLIGDYPRTGSEDFYPHDKALNQVFCDGHVERVLKSQFASQTDEMRRRWFSDNKPHPEFWHMNR